MVKVPMSDGWRLTSAGEARCADVHALDCDCGSWLPISVPTTVQAALVEHGKAPSPWLDQQADLFRKHESDTWLYRKEFELSGTEVDADRYELYFEGVSLFATVWLNGSPVSFIENAHHTHRVDVTSKLNRDRRNILVVECSLRLEEVQKRLRDDIGATSDPARSFVRLCQMSFGWDFAPRLLPIGLWRPVSLACHTNVSLQDLAVRTESIDGSNAALAITAKPLSVHQSSKPTHLKLSIHDDPEGPPVWTLEHQLASDTPVVVNAEIPDARLWYPSPMGEPHLYTLTAHVVHDGVETDRRSLRFGIRTIELKQDDRFTFCINGTDIFARGANWVPPNSLTLDATSDHYRHLLQLAHDAHFNMLRVWGGGTYESDEFYELCDELGIMVWQDFMYACAMYPDDDPAFMASAKHEAEETVQRLRSHPCIVLWCGENECQDTWAGGYEWYKKADRHYGARIYEHLLPDIVSDLSPDIPWWPGSPYGGAATMSLKEGDFHDWYDLPDWRKYDSSAPRFSSEYGFRSVPQRETVDEMISPQYQWDRNGFLHNTWDFHHGTCNWMKEVLPEFGEPESLDDFIMFTQESQATLMRYAVEVYRRKMFGTSGSLIWQYNEPWPAVTFSLVDFYGRAKAAYYWVARAHMPLMGMFYGEEQNPSFWGICDEQEEMHGVLKLRRFNHDGAVLGEVSSEVVLNPNAPTELLATMPSELRIEHPDREFLHSELHCAEYHSERIHHAAMRRDWVLSNAEVAVQVVRVDEKTLRVTISSDMYVHFVSVHVANPVARYSDNFVDLLPGEPRTIVISARDTNGDVIVRAANAPTVTVRV
jgi:beta-mannosidase